MEYPEVVTIHQIASRHRIPVKYLEQILLEPKRAGILTSRRGYLLLPSPSEISVGEVLQIVDSRFIESSCTQQDAERGFLLGPYWLTETSLERRSRRRRKNSLRNLFR